MEQFKQDITQFKTVTVQHAIETIDSNKSGIYFIGRSSCPYCRLFAHKLAQVVRDTQATVYFINSEDTQHLEALQAFRNRYAIATVPGFVRISNGEVTVRCDSSMSPDAIREFMA